ncbi:MAG TPA: D-2-hydroxyacid dehydrogenase [Longimicrobiales bacterium]
MRKAVLNFTDERSRWAITPEAQRQIEQALPEGWQLIVIQSPVSSRGDGSGVSEELLTHAPGTEIYLGSGVPRDFFLAAQPTLRWIHTGSAGVGAALFPELVASDIVLTNSAGIHAPPMAETVLGVMLYFARGFDFAVRAQQAGHWDQTAFGTAASPVNELAGATLGIVGYGGVGRAVAAKARAFGMHVLATRRTAQPSDDGTEIVGGRAGLERLLRTSDVVVITVPATAQTQRLIGRAELALLRQNAVFINVARGSVVDEQALIDVLRAGRIRAAGLDVFEQEPLPESSELWRLPNVLVLPHVSATTPHFWERQAALIIDNFQRYLRGAPLRNVVDKQQGY